MRNEEAEAALSTGRCQSSAPRPGAHVHARMGSVELLTREANRNRPAHRDGLKHMVHGDLGLPDPSPRSSHTANVPRRRVPTTSRRRLVDLAAEDFRPGKAANTGEEDDEERGRGQTPISAPRA